MFIVVYMHPSAPRLCRAFRWPLGRDLVPSRGFLRLRLIKSRRVSLLELCSSPPSSFIIIVRIPIRSYPHPHYKSNTSYVSLWTHQEASGKLLVSRPEKRQFSTLWHSVCCVNSEYIHWFCLVHIYSTTQGAYVFIHVHVLYVCRIPASQLLCTTARRGSSALEFHLEALSSSESNAAYMYIHMWCYTAYSNYWHESPLTALYRRLGNLTSFV